MTAKPMYQYMFELLDYADEITGRIQPDDFDMNSYFMTLVYVEDILDKYGRGLASESAREQGLSDEQVSEIRMNLNTRLNALRLVIRNFSQEYDFDEVLAQRGQGMLKDWQKRR